MEEGEFSPLDLDLQGEEGEELDWLVSQLTGKLTRSTHPSVKQAACLWLLAVVKQCISQSQLIRKVTTSLRNSNSSQCIINFSAT